MSATKKTADIRKPSVGRTSLRSSETVKPVYQGESTVVRNDLMHKSGQSKETLLQSALSNANKQRQATESVQHQIQQAFNIAAKLTSEQKDRSRISSLERSSVVSSVSDKPSSSFNASTSHSISPSLIVQTSRNASLTVETASTSAGRESPSLSRPSSVQSTDTMYTATSQPDCVIPKRKNKNVAFKPGLARPDQRSFKSFTLSQNSNSTRSTAESPRDSLMISKIPSRKGSQRSTLRRTSDDIRSVGELRSLSGHEPYIVPEEEDEGELSEDVHVQITQVTDDERRSSNTSKRRKDEKNEGAVLKQHVKFTEDTKDSSTSDNCKLSPKAKCIATGVAVTIGLVLVTIVVVFLFTKSGTNGVTSQERQTGKSLRSFCNKLDLGGNVFCYLIIYTRC